MTVIDTTTTTDDAGSSRPVPLREGDDRFVPLAAEIGRRAAPAADRHDDDASFVDEAYTAMRELGYLALAVPTELGGLGATLRQACYAQAELARWCGSSSLASTMHIYNTFVLNFRRNGGAADAEAALKRVADEGLVIATSGGSDWVCPTTIATPVDGGFLISGHKSFCSQAPRADVMSTSAVVGSAEPGSEVLHFTLPLRAEGVSIVETWDTLGMRGTASHDVVIDRVFVPEEKIVARRPYGAFGGPLKNAVIHFAPLGGATYWGVAAAARDAAVAIAGRAETARTVGLMDARLRVAWWSLIGSVTELEAGFAPDDPTVATVLLAKREAVLAAREVVDLAMDMAGGRSYFRSAPLERAFRDVRAGTFHPLPPEATLEHAGRTVLGIPSM